jgi:hypothetical protein
MTVTCRIHDRSLTARIRRRITVANDNKAMREAVVAGGLLRPKVCNSRILTLCVWERERETVCVHVCKRIHLHIRTRERARARARERERERERERQTDTDTWAQRGRQPWRRAPAWGARRRRTRRTRRRAPCTPPTKISSR